MSNITYARHFRNVTYTLVILFLLFIFPFQVKAEFIDPQYIFVRKDPMNCNPADCSQLWNMDDPNRINVASINDIYNKIGTRGNTSGTRKLGIGTQFNFYLMDVPRLKQSLANLLDLSKNHDVPIYMSFNGYLWWDKRPDLWNWWEPGISPEEQEKRKANVEWNCNTSSCALKKAYRNWGSEMEVKPPPNLASRVLIDDTKNKLSKELLPLIVDWYNKLPADKKWLFGGIDFGTEIDIGENFYGNGTIGYAAVNTLGLPGGVSETNKATIVRKYIDELDGLAVNMGIPRSKIFNHTHPKFAASGVTNFGNPGVTVWQSKTDIDPAINQIPNIMWASPEWYFHSDFVRELEDTLSYRNNKFLNISNWEQIKNNASMISAISTVINKNPACLVTAPQLHISVAGSSATFTWNRGAHNDSLSLNVSNSEGYSKSGTLQTPNIIVENNLSAVSFTKSGLSPGSYFAILAADGCGNQRRISYDSFAIGSSTPETFNLSSYNGKAVKGSGAASYKIENGHKRAIPDWDTYLSLGFTAADQITLSDAQINTIPNGAPMQTVKYNSDTAMTPFWQGTTMHDESMLPVSRGGAAAEAAFLFPPTQVISVRSASFTTTYDQGSDWIVSGGKIKLPTGSRIPFVTDTNLTPSLSTPLSYFHDRQIVVTYTHNADWNGPVPHYAGTQLPNTLAKLIQKQPVKMILYGDSISVGYNTSGLLNLPPHQPVWGQLVGNTLQDTYGSPVTFVNASKVSQTSAWGAQNVRSLVSSQSPDLVILAFGMNDGTAHIDATTFKNNILLMISDITSVNPKAEVIVVTPTLANPASTFAGTQQSFKPDILSLVKSGVAVADMTGVHEELLKTKTFADITGNNINHPNDFLARWYAQEVSGLLMYPSGSKTTDGDVDGNGKVNEADFHWIRDHFKTSYTIFDYNALVRNYNKTTSALQNNTTTTIPTHTPTNTPVPVFADELFTYGNAGDIPIVGNWFGGKKDVPAVVRGNNWLMKKAFSGPFADATVTFTYSPPAKAYYLACDWTGSGTKTPTIVSNGVWNIRTANTSGAPDITFGFGLPTDIPVCGDWNGDGFQSPGLFRNGQWFLSNSRSNPLAEIVFSFGNGTDTPLVGHWTGTKQDFVGVFRNGVFYLKNSNSDGNADTVITFGNPGDTPIIGDWTGSGKSQIGVVRSNTWYLKK